MGYLLLYLVHHSLLVFDHSIVYRQSSPISIPSSISMSLYCMLLFVISFFHYFSDNSYCFPSHKRDNWSVIRKQCSKKIFPELSATVTDSLLNYVRFSNTWFWNKSLGNSHSNARLSPCLSLDYNMRSNSAINRIMCKINWIVWQQCTLMSWTTPTPSDEMVGLVSTPTANCETETNRTDTIELNNDIWRFCYF